MIVCQSCKHEEFEGALFCSNCGALIPGAAMVTQNIQHMPTEQFSIPATPVNAPPPPPSGPLESLISLYVMDAGQIIPLAGRDDFTLGRSSEGQTVLPDVDLSPFQAYEKGVSRLHATLKINTNPAALTDLGSVNGTRLNGQRIPPSKAMPLQHGDIITLGKLKVQMIIRR